jgi:hypothetical protein
MCVGNQALGTFYFHFIAFLNYFIIATFFCWKAGAGRCSSEPTEELFAGFRGAFHCLVEGGGDVAFVRHTTPFENTGENICCWKSRYILLTLFSYCSRLLNRNTHHTDGNNLENWAVGLSSNNFRLLCLDGGVRPVQEYQTCNLGKVPAPKVSFSVLMCSEGRNSAFFFVRWVYKNNTISFFAIVKVMTDGWKSAERTQDIRAVLLRLSDLFSPSFGGQVIFRLFGPYEGVPNLLFTVIPFLHT